MNPPVFFVRFLHLHFRVRMAFYSIRKTNWNWKSPNVLRTKTASTRELVEYIISNLKSLVNIRFSSAENFNDRILVDIWQIQPVASLIRCRGLKSSIWRVFFFLFTTENVFVNPSPAKRVALPLSPAFSYAISVTFRFPFRIRMFNRIAPACSVGLPVCRYSRRKGRALFFASKCAIGKKGEKKNARALLFFVSRKTLHC